jgi:hypothetical protein
MNGGSNKKQQISLAAIHSGSTVQGNREASQSVPSLVSHELAHDAPAKHQGGWDQPVIGCRSRAPENGSSYRAGRGREAASLHPVRRAPILLGHELRSWGVPPTEPLAMVPLPETGPGTESTPSTCGHGQPDSEIRLLL